MSVQLLIQLLLKIVVMILLGYCFKKWGIISEELKKGLNQLLVTAILPICILMTSNHDYTPALVQSMKDSAFISVGYFAGAIVVMTLLVRALPLPKERKGVFATMVVFSNSGFIGFPITMELFGVEGNLCAVIYNILFNILFFTYGVSQFSGEAKIQWKKLLKSPVTLAAVATVVLFLAQIKLPAGIAGGLTSVGDMTTPLSLIIIGCELASVKLSLILSDLWSYLVSALRLLACPLALLAVLKLLGCADTIAAQACLVITALPSGSLNVIYAQEMNCDADFASRTVIQTMVLMIVTVPLVLFLMYAI